jgi:hypothetical protein
MADENESGTTALVLTNQTDTELLNSNNDDGEGAHAPATVVYENDFDLYSLIKEMILAKTASAAATKRTIRKNSFKNYTKQLTARLLDSHYTNGKAAWCLEQNGIDLYRSKVQCIGTDVNDFDYGQPVYLDLQPLSTRIKLMCKLIIIIQGACVERNGPPKLVQDRCTQVDECRLTDDPAAPTSNLKRQNSIATKKKSTSCENLLDTSDREISLDVEQKSGEAAAAAENAEENLEISISIYGTTNKSDSIKPVRVVGNGFKRKLSRKKSFRSSHSSAMTSTAVATTNCFSDDEFSTSTTITTNLVSPRGFSKPFSKQTRFSHKGTSIPIYLKLKFQNLIHINHV